MSVAVTREIEPDAEPEVAERHPPGLVVLFLTEMWERYSFYTVGAIWALYVQNTGEKGGFGWTQDHATSVWSNYLMFVFLSPVLGGIIADRKFGYRRSVILGGFFFMGGHALLAMQDVKIMYLALACLVVGNGFFKPNVSAMVGNLYREGSHLKDRAYNIFYMGINIGAALAPLVAEFMVSKFGYHPTFFLGVIGMLISVSILWRFKHHVMYADRAFLKASVAGGAAADAAPAGAGHPHPIDLIPDSRRILALIVIFLVVIAFWMVFHQQQTTLTYWANNNTDWNVSGIISNAINPLWVLLLTPFLVLFWQAMDRKGLEPSTPAKMAIGMCLTAASFFVLYFAGKAGGDSGKVSPLWLIGAYGVLTLGELMLSPMGLSLVSKVAPLRLRGLMMGGWFMATAFGNKLTVIGVLWDDMPHSRFFALLGLIALGMAMVLLLLLRPLKKAMPGV